jgi:hypothetical protein
MKVLRSAGLIVAAFAMALGLRAAAYLVLSGNTADLTFWLGLVLIGLATLVVARRFPGRPIATAIAGAAIGYLYMRLDWALFVAMVEQTGRAESVIYMTATFLTFAKWPILAGFAFIGGVASANGAAQREGAGE